MADSHRTRNNGTVSWYRWSVVLLIVGVGVYAGKRDLPQLHLEYRDVSTRVDRSVAQLESITAESKALQRRVDYLRSDPLEVEAAVRSEKNLLREGETVYRIILPDERPRE